jgi:antitoxin HicB
MKNTEKSMNKNYRVALQYDPDGYWIAEHPELPGCKADGQSAQEALSSLDVSRELWIESALATGLEVPEPQEAPQYSGRFVLRIPKSLHRDLAKEAEVEGVSLNSHVSNVLSGRHTRKEQVAHVEQAVPLNYWPSLQMQSEQKQRSATLGNVIPISSQQPQQPPFVANCERRAINA